MSASFSYRRDIEGLRAVAVLAVVLYHLPIGGVTLAGGFLGVDLFFVLSGYLITGLLAAQLTGPQQPALGPWLKAFFLRRCKRLLPALIAVIAVTLALGFLIMVPEDFAELTRSSTWSLLALANAYFYFDTGYFDQAAHLRPLLHLWSLAIEEQFYLLWPLVLYASWKLDGRRAALTLAVLISLVSFGWALQLGVTDSKAAFYSPGSRAWELALGGVLALLPQGAVRDRGFTGALLQSFGLALIALAFARPELLGPLPGAGTLLPVAGTMLCLAFPNRALPARFLCVGPVRYLGRISYALYLWHWPVLVLFLHYNNGRAPAAAEATGLLVLALMLASISYHLVEHPVRRAVHLAPGQRWALLGATFALLAVMIAAPLTSGTLGRPLPQAVALTGPTAAWSWQPRAETATDLPGYVAVGAPWSQAERRLVLWGDSHAGHYAPLLEALYAGQTPATAILLYDRHPPAGRSCPPTYGLPEDAPQGRSQRYREGCIADRARMLRYLARPGSRVDGVVLAISWNSRWRAMGSDREDRQGIARQQAALEKLLQELKALSIPVAVLGQVPQWTHDPMPCVAGQALELLRSDCAVELPAAALADDFERVHQGLAGLAGPGLTVLLPHRSLCATGRCLTTIADTFLYADRGHLRRDLTDPTRRALLDAMVLAPLRTWSAGLGADVTDLRDDSHRRRRDELTVERGVRIAHATQRELLTDP